MNEATYYRRELPGGARLVMESVPGRRSVAVGVWVRAGSRDELPGFEGAAHLIEHLAFKGTRRRTGRGTRTCSSDRCAGTSGTIC